VSKYHDLFIVHFLVGNKESKQAADDTAKTMEAAGLKCVLIGNTKIPDRAVESVRLTPIEDASAANPHLESIAKSLASIAEGMAKPRMIEYPLGTSREGGFHVSELTKEIREKGVVAATNAEIARELKETAKVA
jgi:hypothetical protein